MHRQQGRAGEIATGKSGGECRLRVPPLSRRDSIMPKKVRPPMVALTILPRLLFLFARWARSAAMKWPTVARNFPWRARSIADPRDRRPDPITLENSGGVVFKMAIKIQNFQFLFVRDFVFFSFFYVETFTRITFVLTNVIIL